VSALSILVGETETEAKKFGLYLSDVSLKRLGVWSIKIASIKELQVRQSLNGQRKIVL
jgi:hypothetical protein